MRQSRSVESNTRCLLAARLLAILLLMFPAGDRRPGGASAGVRSDLPIEMVAPAPPVPVRSEGGVHFVYEIHFTNFHEREFGLKEIEVFCDGGEIPDTLHHRFLFTFADPESGRVERRVDGYPVPVRRGEPPVLSFPVRGGEWLLANGPSPGGDRRRFIMAIDGRSCNSQRFAVDLIKLDRKGKPVQGDPGVNENWVGHGEEVLAVADGTILAVRDGLPENVPLASERAVKMNRRSTGGNQIVLELGGGRYAFYAHLLPGSIRVAPGEKVRRGDPLARIGNSGNSDAPHLHFHLMDRPDPFAAEGIPFLFDFFGVMKKMTPEEIEWLLVEGVTWKESWSAGVSERQSEIPLGTAVLRIP